MVPEGWQRVRLGDLFRLSRKKGSAGLPTMSVTLRNGLVFRNSLERKTDTNLAPEEHLLIEKGDIAYNMMRMWQGASGLASCSALVSPAYVVLKPKPDIDPLFASYFFKAPRTIYLFWAYSYGLTKDRLRLYFDDFSAIPVVVPPVEEQRRIGAILHTWDRAIGVLESLIANHQQQQMGLLQVLLEPKDTWEVKKLAKLTKIYDGTHATPKYVQSGVPFYSVEHVTSDDFSSTRFIAEDVFAKESKRVVLERDDILMTRIGDIGTARLIDWDVRASFYVSLALIKASQHVRSAYLRHYIRSPRFRRELHKRTLHLAFPKKINLGDIGECPIALPSLDEQERIASVLSKSERQLRILKRERDSLRREKSALMQQLLSGNRRVGLGADSRQAVAG